MNVEIPPQVRDAASRLGNTVPYALKVLAGQLAENPDTGRPSGRPGILTVMVDGDFFEDCPDLAVGYIREPDRIEIWYVNSTSTAEPVADARDQDRLADPVNEAITEREATHAWQRIIRWLQHNAPDSHAALRAGADLAALTALEDDLGVRIPAGLRAVWLLTAGDDGVNGRGCLPGNEALMALDEVAAFHRQQMDAQAHEDTLNARRSEYDRITVWRAAWIRVVAFGPADRTSGLYLDTTTGCLGRWSRYNEGPGGELDTLVTCLEEIADVLEAPALATRDRPGLIGGALAWGSRLGASQEDRWQPLTG
ncbi:hypothetical protein ACIQ7D_05175 [Streptomyces sp. NPDC096310]|uniref:hypothetical protein n=1 Tax=Streptomyces sp. NPDC096310 TaxID=3366082 RepID=UPI0037FC1A11